MEVGLVRSIDIDHEMQQAYLDYAMSVIVARALPDARDGLKPVHRRILYAMYDMGLRPDSSFKKSARIVGEVLGKYHPHGDMAVYESMARMAQDFSMRTLLVEGQGNFGSVDGDPPAAMRYTEARLADPAMHLLADIRKNTVNFSANFDGSLEEPDVLPAALPNLLVNGATGIAVGMSTNIPPHNLGEVIDALVHMLTYWDKLDDINVEDLMRFIQGPDFPTGGIIIQGSEEEDLKTAYGTGRGRITVQARAHLESMDRGRSRIIVSELPYMTNKSSLIERIAELARESRIEGIADLRDESDRQGLRIVIELTRTAEPEAVLKDLYKNTPMRTTFGIIMLALVEGEPRMLSLKQALRFYLEHRLEVIRRRAEFDLEKARQRAHILEGLLVALKYLDEVIDLIRRSPDADVARQRLMKKYRLSEVQAQAILDMPLRRLAALERKKIEDEYKELKAQIKELEALLKSPTKMRQLAAEELKAVKEAFADRRRTQIAKLGPGGKAAAPLLTASELLPQATVWISATAEGLVSRSHDDSPPRISGTAAPLWSIQASTRDVLYLVAENGEAASIFVHALPEASTPAEGTPLHKVSPLVESSRLCTLLALPPREERPENQFVFTCTRQGLVKRSALSELPPPAARPFTLVKVNEGDSLGWVRLTDGQAELLLATANGMAIRFKEDEVRPMGLVAAGVGGIKLQGSDHVVGMELIPAEGSILFVTSDGKAKRLAPRQLPAQGRYGQGVIAWKLPRTAQLAGIASGMPTTRVTLHLDRLAPKAMRLDEAPEQTRAASGKPVLDLRAGYKVVSVSSLQEALPTVTPGESGEAKKRSRKSASRNQAKEIVQATFEDLLQIQPAGKTPSKSSRTTTPKASSSRAPAGRTTRTKSSAPAAKKSAEKQAAASKSTTRKPATARKTSGRAGAKASPSSASAGRKPAAKATSSTTRATTRSTAQGKTSSGEKVTTSRRTGTKSTSPKQPPEKATRGRGTTAKTAPDAAKPARSRTRSTTTSGATKKPTRGRKPAAATSGSKETTPKPTAGRGPGKSSTAGKKPAGTPSGRTRTTKTPAGKPDSKPAAKKNTTKATPRKPGGK